MNAGVLALSYGMLSVHELTAILDVAYAAGRREVTPIEQYVHGLQGRVPMVTTTLLTLLHWGWLRLIASAQLLQDRQTE